MPSAPTSLVRLLPWRWTPRLGLPQAKQDAVEGGSTCGLQHGSAGASTRSAVNFRWLTSTLSLAAFASVFSIGADAWAEDERLANRMARLQWEDAKLSQLSVTVAFREAITPEVQAKLTRGLPTSILLTAGLYARGSEEPVGTTVQTCRVTWHVWEEAYRVELSRANLPVSSSWTTTLEGVMRRCGEAKRLPIMLLPRFRRTMTLSMRARVLVNPIGDELLQKIKRWVSRPTGPNASAPSDALFGTFTGFFMQHIGEAERTVVFETFPVLPTELSTTDR